MPRKKQKTKNWENFPNTKTFHRIKTLFGFVIAVILVIIFAPTPSSSFGFAEQPAVESETPIMPTETPVLIATPTLVPTDTPLPTPTIGIPSGYCLAVPVLYYHHIQPQPEAVNKKQTALSVDATIFASQMAYLNTQHYTTITAKQLVDALKNHTSLPEKSIVLTFDDGYKDIYTYAYPIFKQYHITANLLIASGLVEGADYLSWSQLSEMKNSGLFYLIDHTWSHFSLPQADVTKMQFEIQTAKQEIEQHTGQQITLFGYPYGAFNSQAIRVLQQDGFSGAFATYPGRYQCDSQIMSLPRTRVGNAPLSIYGL